jgi:hypothetical protein
MELIEIKKGEVFCLTMTGAEKDKFLTLFDEFLNPFENYRKVKTE